MCSFSNLPILIGKSEPKIWYITGKQIDFIISLLLHFTVCKALCIV